MDTTLLAQTMIGSEIEDIKLVIQDCEGDDETVLRNIGRRAGIQAFSDVAQVR